MKRMMPSVPVAVLAVAASIASGQTKPADPTIEFAGGPDAASFSSPDAWRGRDGSPRTLSDVEGLVLLFRPPATGDLVVTNDLGSADAPLKVHAITLAPGIKPLQGPAMSLRVEGNPIRLEPLTTGEPPRITAGARDPKKELASFDLATDIHFATALALVGEGNQLFRISGNLRGDDPAASLTKNGAARVELVGEGSWTGPTLLNGGILALKDGSSLGTGPLKIEASATLMLLPFAQRAGLSESLEIAEKGKLDLNGGTWIIDYTDDTPYAFIQTMIRDGRIVTANPRADQVVTCVEASTLDIHHFQGRALDKDMIIITVARAGDTNLDSRVDREDLKRLRGSFNKPGDWSDGDVTGDGRVDFDDLLKISQHYDPDAVFQQDWDALPN